MIQYADSCIGGWITYGQIIPNFLTSRNINIKQLRFFITFSKDIPVKMKKHQERTKREPNANSESIFRGPDSRLDIFYKNILTKIFIIFVQRAKMQILRVF